jgi:hypothetical protein
MEQFLSCEEVDASGGFVDAQLAQQHGSKVVQCLRPVDRESAIIEVSQSRIRQWFDY